MNRLSKYLYLAGWMLILNLTLIGCNGGDNNTSSSATGGASSLGNISFSAKRPLNPYTVQQFVTPLTVIPAATPDTTSISGSDFYTVSMEQTAQYDFGLREMDGSEFHDAYGNPLRTTVWGYRVNGLSTGYLGPSIEARSTLPANTVKPGRPVVVKFINNLRASNGALLTRHILNVDPTLDDASRGEIRVVTHLHGGHTAAGFDGNPEFWFTNNPNAAANGEGGPAGNTVTYTYDNDQLGTTLWYHDHAMGITRLNVYVGLAAFYLLRDDQEDSQNLPKGAYEIPLVIQDKSFNDDGSLDYAATPLLNPSNRLPMVDVNGQPILTSGPEFFGNTIVVNGKVWPKLEVEPRKYRFRVLNGSDSRFYHLWLELPGGAPLPANTVTQVGNDGGLLPAPVAIGNSSAHGLLLSLAERADLVIDFSKFPLGTKITMRNDANGPYPGGDAPDPKTTGKIMQFQVTKPLAATDTSAATGVRPITHLGAPDTTRVIDLQELRDDYGINFDPANEGTMAFRHLLLLNGALFSDPVTETPKLNTVEDWIIVNGTVDMHPIHLHLVNFEILEKGTVTGYVPADPASGIPASFSALNPDTDAAGLTPANPLFDPNYTVSDNERGLKDTVKVPPGAVDANGDPSPSLPRGYVRIRAKFDRLGTYMYHCHILSHEDNAMMRPFTVIP
jgi:spore coat protein A, manganese oxidase